MFINNHNLTPSDWTKINSRKFCPDPILGGCRQPISFPFQSLPPWPGRDRPWRPLLSNWSGHQKTRQTSYPEQPRGWGTYVLTPRNPWMDGWMGGWMDGWVGGWADGWVGRQANDLLSSCNAPTEDTSKPARRLTVCAFGNAKFLVLGWPSQLGEVQQCNLRNMWSKISK